MSSLPHEPKNEKKIIVLELSVVSTIMQPLPQESGIRRGTTPIFHPHSRDELQVSGTDEQGLHPVLLRSQSSSSAPGSVGNPRSCLSILLCHSHLMSEEGTRKKSVFARVSLSLARFYQVFKDILEEIYLYFTINFEPFPESLISSILK